MTSHIRMSSGTARAAVAWALAALSVVLLQYVTGLNGPGLGHDSAQYLSAADGLRSGAGFLRCDGRLYDIWAPLQPLLLALPLELGASPASAALIVNAISLAALVALTGRMASAIAPGAGWIAALGLLLSLDLLWIEAQLLSEPAFMTLAAAAVVATESHARHPTGRRLALLAACVALAGLQRYVGVTLIASTALALLARPAHETLRRRALRAALFALAAGLPLGLWMLRNLALTGTPTGPDRGQWGTGLGALWFLRRTGVVMQDWFCPGVAWPDPRLVLLSGTGVLLAVAAVRSRRALASAWRGPALAPALFFLAYGVFSWVYHANIEEDGVKERELVPLLPFAWALLAGGALALVRAARRRSPREGRWLAIALACVFALHVVDSVRYLAGTLPSMRQKIFPFAYNLPRWQDDALWDAVRARAGAGPLLSNDPELVYVLTRLRNQPFGGSRGIIRLISRELADGPPGTLVWLPHNKSDILPLDVVERLLVLEPLFGTPVGAVYAFRARRDGASGD